MPNILHFIYDRTYTIYRTDIYLYAVDPRTNAIVDMDSLRRYDLSTLLFNVITIAID